LLTPVSLLREIINDGRLDRLGTGHSKHKLCNFALCKWSELELLGKVELHQPIDDCQLHLIGSFQRPHVLQGKMIISLIPINFLKLCGKAKGMGLTMDARSLLGRLSTILLNTFQLV
jgi:hypothetical protein